MMRFLFFLTTCLAQNVAAALPNLVLIVADDLGYGETGMMGESQIPTPAIDQLAGQGVRCTAGYVTSSYCSPSRAGYLTGRYQARFGYDHNPVGEKNSHPNAGLPAGQSTFLQPLREAGYRTALIGKWHLGTRPWQRPSQKGFDKFFGFLHEGHYYVPGPPHRHVWTMVRDRDLPEGQLLREGQLFRGNYAPISEPFYDKNNPVLDGREIADWQQYLTDEITDRAVRFIQSDFSPSALVVSYSAVHSPMQALDRDYESLSHIDDPQRRIFAGMLIALDRGVGRILDAIEQAGAAERTLVVFISDNGGPSGELTSSNAPLRGEKGSLYEGGIRVPMVWRMPERLPAGVVENRPVISLDIAATMTQMALGNVPADYDGVNVANWLGRDDQPAPARDLYWRMPRGGAAIRRGNYKWVRQPRSGVTELFDLRRDIAEAVNLTGRRPGLAAQMRAVWEAIDATMADPLTLQ